MTLSLAMYVHFVSFVSACLCRFACLFLHVLCAFVHYFCVRFCVFYLLCIFLCLCPLLRPCMSFLTLFSGFVEF